MSGSDGRSTGLVGAEALAAARTISSAAILVAVVDAEGFAAVADDKVSSFIAGLQVTPTYRQRKIPTTLGREFLYDKIYSRPSALKRAIAALAALALEPV
jgi:hypothetical protein